VHRKQMKREWVRNPLTRKIVEVYSSGPAELMGSKQQGAACAAHRVVCPATWQRSPTPHPPMAAHSRARFSRVRGRAGFPPPPREPAGCSAPCSPGSCWRCGPRRPGLRVQQPQPAQARGAFALVFGVGSLLAGRQVAFVLCHSSHLF